MVSLKDLQIRALAVVCARISRRTLAHSGSKVHPCPMSILLELRPMNTNGRQEKLQLRVLPFIDLQAWVWVYGTHPSSIRGETLLSQFCSSSKIHVPSGLILVILWWKLLLFIVYYGWGLDLFSKEFVNINTP